VLLRVATGNCLSLCIKYLDNVAISNYNNNYDDSSLLEPLENQNSKYMDNVIFMKG